MNTQDQKQLPTGFTCSDCQHFNFCSNVWDEEVKSDSRVCCRKSITFTLAAWSTKEYPAMQQNRAAFTDSQQLSA